LPSSHLLDKAQILKSWNLFGNELVLIGYPNLLGQGIAAQGAGLLRKVFQGGPTQLIKTVAIKAFFYSKLF
jgi:hypothetical protein